MASLLMLSSSCVTVKYDESISDYRVSIRKMEARLRADSNDFDALQQLGIIYFQTKQYAQATEYLRRASSLDKDDPKTLFYLGMSLESQNNSTSALAVYLNYTEVSSLSPYRRLMEGRYQLLTREVIKEQMRSLIAREKELGAQVMSPKTVAVFPLAYQGTDEKFSALGKGLSEMMIIDLGQVKGLTLVERIRVEALLAELKFGQSKSVDPATAPRVGKFLTAGRIVTGSFNVSRANQIRLDAAFYDVPNRKFPDAVSRSDALDNLFRLEKDLVFGVITQMGIKLSRVEREKIQRIPTKNMQAFLAYSKGLEKEDAGDFRGASVYYKQAVNLDANFAPAKSKAEATDALSYSGESRGSTLAAAQRIEPPPKPEIAGPTTDLIPNRFKNLETNIGSNFVPGQDSREPAEEAAAAGSAIGELPKPPRPPGQ